MSRLTNFLKTEEVQGFFKWLPRILAILFILFIQMFALDVFGQGYGFWGTVIAFTIHTIPSAVLLVMLIVSWKFDIVGGWIHIIVSLIFMAFFCSVLLGLPLALIGLLFLFYEYVIKKYEKKKLD